MTASGITAEEFSLAFGVNTAILGMPYIPHALHGRLVWNGRCLQREIGKPS